LSRVTIGSAVATIGFNAFGSCPNLVGAYFRGNAPIAYGGTFEWSDKATVYYLPNTFGWGPSFDNRPTVLWNPQVSTTDATFGVVAGQFGFTITGHSGLEITVEACTDLVLADWLVLGTVTLTDGSFHVLDPEPANQPGRFFRLRSP